MYVTYGGGSGTVQQTSGPNVRPSVILNTYGTAWSSGYVASGVYGQGGAGGAGGASGAGSSGIVSPTPISSTVISGAASGQSGTALSGIVSSAPLSPIFSTIVSTGISGESSTEGSGSNAPFSNSIDSRYGTLAPSSEITPTPIFSTALSTEINGASSTKGSGSVPPFSSSIKSRSGSLPPLSGFQSSGSVRLSTGPSSAPFTNSINSRSGSLPPSGTGSIPLSTAFVPTSSPLSGVPFTNSLNSRSGSLPPPSSAPSGTGFSPSSSWGTGSSFFSTGFTAPYVTGTLLSAPPGDFTESIPFSIPTGYLPSNSLPGTGSLGVPFTNSINSRSGSLPPSGTARPTTGSMPTGGVPLSIAPSSGLPFTNSINSRSGTLPTSSGAVPSSTGTSPATSPLTTFPPYPTAASSCVTNFLGTTTIFTTVTSFGCYANCPAGGGGGYGNNVNTFGPPTFGGQGGWGP
ncbi:hypothetical protein DOTSEDRAFT_68251 [Dothistroma septosporum NZE10]|uniref:Uncharacterized protein n=1 Tax=Dothistroma septosporum (strain NZE10 / CBS 128990) TaxID=675120 RepID=N1Q2D9_DOTSN|nr:hypothetical protein DOTSEDRAFT_68251 [Dothistroma septosporum NZE10]